MKVRKEMAEDPEYKGCMLRAHPTHSCGGRITIEHPFIYAGRQVDFKNALISVCAKGQEVDHYQDAHTMDKNLNRWVALNRMTEEEIESVAKVTDWSQEKERLNEIYGDYIPYRLANEEISINYGF